MHATDTPSQDRRREPRVRPADAWLRFRVGDRYLLGPVEDLSASGVRVRADVALKHGTYVEGTLEAPGRRASIARGFVVGDSVTTEHTRSGRFALALSTEGRTERLKWVHATRDAGGTSPSAAPPSGPFAAPLVAPLVAPLAAPLAALWRRVARTRRR